MDWVIEPAVGAPPALRFTVPGDKSISHRALLFNTLAVQDERAGRPARCARIRGLLDAEDVMRTMEACRRLGASITRDGQDWLVTTARAADGPLDIDCGNSGTTARLLLGALAGLGRRATLHGDASLSRRPMGRVISPLTEMGATFQTGGRPTLPLTIQPGMLRGVDWMSTVASAQVKSAVLLAGTRAEGTTRYTEPTPSRDHTERMLGRMGADLDVTGTTSTITARPLCPVDVVVPGDISSAAFWLVAACVVGRSLTIDGVGVNPTRTGCINALTAMGAEIRGPAGSGTDSEPAGELHVRGDALGGTVIEGTLIPRLIDEIPVLAIAAAFAEGETVIRDAAELRVKESDRIAVVVDGLRAMGVDADATPDGMRILGRGGRGVHAADVHSHGDHRIAMAFAIAGLASGMRVRDVECVNTSYPGFLATLKRLSPGSRIAL